MSEMQVRAICVQIAYHSKLGVSSLSGDSKNAHHSPPLKRPPKSFTSIQMFHTHAPPGGDFFEECEAEQNVRGKADTARYVHVGQPAVLSSRRKIAR